MVNHFPVIMVITETRVGRDRAKKIIEDLPFDGSLVADTIGYAGGLWLLWKKDGVDISVLSSTKQEIHATVKVEQEITIEKMRQGGKWQWNAISFDLPLCIKVRLLATPIQLYGLKGDTMN
nr:hypothetical protein CFP56_36807 [Quercus suber]